MESHTSGTLVGTGTFRCVTCDYVVSLAAADRCPPARAAAATRSCAPRCSRRRASGADAARRRRRRRARRARSRSARRDRRRRASTSSTTTAATPVVTRWTREWTRVGRSLAADIRFDDPTVSRRHALIVRQPDGVRVLDDRSLNGVFVNGERIEWHVLRDGDELVVGRHRLHFVDSRPTRRPSARAARSPARRASGRLARGERRSRAAGSEPRRLGAYLVRGADGGQTIAVLSQKGGTGKTTTVRTLTDVFRRAGLDDARGRPRPAGQPLRLPRRRPRGAPDRRRRAERPRDGRRGRPRRRSSRRTSGSPRPSWR